MRPPRLLVHFTTTLLLSACSGSGDNCPGLCPDETAVPIMTISTDDGSASIASARMLSGPCTYLLLGSSGEAGMPTSYASVQVTYSGPRDASAVCQLELTSRFGQTVAISAEVRVSPYQQPCCPYGTCCATESTVTQHHHAEFVPPTQTVSFPPPPDGGASDSTTDGAVDTLDAAADAASDGPTEPGEIDAARSDLDLARVDFPSVDPPVVDGSMVDSPSLESRALDGAMLDGREPFDLASGS